MKLGPVNKMGMWSEISDALLHSRLSCRSTRPEIIYRLGYRQGNARILKNIEESLRVSVEA